MKIDSDLVARKQKTTLGKLDNDVSRKKKNIVSLQTDETQPETSKIEKMKLLQASTKSIEIVKENVLQSVDSDDLDEVLKDDLRLVEDIDEGVFDDDGSDDNNFVVTQVDRNIYDQGEGIDDSYDINKVGIKYTRRNKQPEVDVKPDAKIFNTKKPYLRMISRSCGVSKETQEIIERYGTIQNASPDGNCGFYQLLVYFMLVLMSQRI